MKSGKVPGAQGTCESTMRPWLCQVLDSRGHGLQVSAGAHVCLPQKGGMECKRSHNTPLRVTPRTSFSVGPGDRTQVVGLGSKHPYSLGALAGPPIL